MIIVFKSACLLLIPMVFITDDAPRVFGAKGQIKVTLIRVNKGHGKSFGVSNATEKSKAHILYYIFYMIL